MPTLVLDTFRSKSARCRNKAGKQQPFSNVILVNGSMGSQILLRSSIDWVDSELNNFYGNLLTCSVVTGTGLDLKVTCVHSPAWPVDRKRTAGLDVSSAKLTQNRDVWVADLLWASLKEMIPEFGGPWIIAGDFNLSETFDAWKGGPRGNLEYLQRMRDLNLTECLRTWNGKLTPTYQNKNEKGFLHQMDHMFVTRELANSLIGSIVGSEDEIVVKNLSDHLPIISDFR